MTYVNKWAYLLGRDGRCAFSTGRSYEICFQLETVVLFS